MTSLTTRLQEATGPLDESAANRLADELATAILDYEYPVLAPTRPNAEQREWLKVQSLICYALQGGIKSVGAALELVERKLPGVEFELGTTYGPARVELGVNMDGGPYYAERLDGNIPLTILQALISALSNQGEADDA